MLNKNEQDIMNVIKDEKYMKIAGITLSDIEKAVRLAVQEFKELEEIVKDAYNSNENFKELCARLKGHNEELNEEYPNCNYFDLNYKSLLITVKEILDKENNSVGFYVSKSGVYIYPNNISKESVDELCVLDLEQEVDFNKIKNEIEKDLEQEMF